MVFVSSLRNSKKKFLTSLAHRVCDDRGSITRKNIDAIEKESKCSNVLSLNPRYVASNVIYAPVPENEMWRIGVLKELLSVRSNEQELEGFTSEEVEELISLVATS